MMQLKPIRAAVKEACREQREICADQYNHWQPVGQHHRDIRDAIKNAPEPKF